MPLPAFTFRSAAVALLLCAALTLTAAHAPAAERLELGDELALELHLPAGEGPHPAVLLLHGCSGLEDSVLAGLRDHAEALTSAGYLAAIVDSFSRRNKDGGMVCESLGELNLARYYRTKDAFAVKAYLAARGDVDPAAIFLIGQSNGGSVALLAAQRAAVKDGATPFAGIVAYYPWCGALDRYPKLASPLLVLGGGKDDWVAPDGCVLRAGDAEGAAMQVHVYPDAYHSFDLPIEKQFYAGHIVGGDRAATEDSRARYLAFLGALRKN